MSVAWNPIDNDDIEAKKAFDALSRSVDKVILPSAEQGQPSRFILRSKAYFDVQAYVLSGRDFPTGYTDFDKIPDSTFNKLWEIDSEIYSKTEDTMIAVGSTCWDYHENHLAKLVTVGQTAIQYSDDSVDLFETAEDINLRHQLDIILDDKYASYDDFDDDYRDAKEAAQLTLSMLRDNARDKYNRTNEITQTLVRAEADIPPFPSIQFRERVLDNQSAVRYLIKQYKTGPVENRSDKKTPYVEILNKDLADNLFNLSNKVNEVRDKYSDWETNTSIPVGTCWIGPLGWAVMSIHGTKDSDLYRAYNGLQDLMAKHQQDRQGETELISFVNQLATQYTDIDQKMADAIAARTELSQLFRNQAECYDKIAVSIDRMKPTTDLRGRKQYIQYQMKVAIGKLRELKVVAEEFTRSIMTQVKL
ncbi:uncharacterized protein B0J16DRAFT_317799 [Fusarium flagelliforme]|uniref:Uncharacterized protein n=1 Tax=Fusarium flagelliforme TaxID=2675880 RepID=A0A395M627_9HYPO|nr:uncharacterized protein B0J16DRAFT_317799 [Fusarium flagelliforme]KAH7188129.1 hypothetical protein B0J16DRAFT_317799 [Fusarium flagelliforme]RFN43286.1 hypothetical protein FIE12Z_12476 [Fusarium flagelliforme]